MRENQDCCVVSVKTSLISPPSLLSIMPHSFALPHRDKRLQAKETGINRRCEPSQE
jgi:hypothetical protein